MPFNPTDASLEFKTGDSIILETRAKSGYTFINWVRDGKGVSNDPIYGFKLDSLDIDKTTHFVKHHYEARFGLDYAIQSIPSIDIIIPHELIAEMGSNLHFGDNPPFIDSLSFNSLRLKHFIHNSDHPEIPYNTDLMYYQTDSQLITTKFQFKFYGQHRGVFDSCNYLRNIGPINMPDPTNPPPIVYYYYEYANIHDSIFIMGNGNDFTIYYHQSQRRRVHPATEMYNNVVGGMDLISKQSVIISGTISEQGDINDFHFGYRIEQYNKQLTSPVEIKRIPAIHDMFHFENP